MSAYAANPADSLRRPLVWSLAFHLSLGAGLLVSTIRTHRGELWGGGGAMSVGLVASVPGGVPLARPDTVTPSRVVDETRGLHREEPQPVVPPPPVPETPIPEFRAEQPRKLPPSRPSKVLEDKTEPPPGAVPYGQGGAPQAPYGAAFGLGQGGTTGGMGFEGAGAGPGGDFASQYSWYVEAVRQKISNHWLQSTIDPRLSFAPRVVVTFQILRSGSVVNVEMLRSSGNASVDRSALRAVLDASPMQPLPSAYRGSYVQVEFWFDFKR